MSGQVYPNFFYSLGLALCQSPFRSIDFASVWCLRRLVYVWGLCDLAQKNLSLDPGVELEEGASSLFPQLRKVLLELLKLIVACLWVLVLRLSEH